MFAFRDAFHSKDAAKEEDIRIDGERVLAERGSLRRRGADERILKADLTADLIAMVETISLNSSMDLADLPAVRRSVLNYGLDDLTSITLGSESVDRIGANLRQALLDFEPRLSAATLVVERQEHDDDLDQRVRFQIRADMICRPFDIPIEFIAEFDTASSKIVVPRPPGS
jgi:type VI secretion system protein ImpF